MQGRFNVQFLGRVGFTLRVAEPQIMTCLNNKQLVVLSRSRHSGTAPKTQLHNVQY